MALTIGIEIKGVIANADASPDTAMAGSLWDEDGSGTDSFTILTFLYGNNCFAGLYSNKAGYQYYDIGAANVLDFTPGTTGKYHYDAQTATYVDGKYKVTFIATDGTRISIGEDTFVLE